MYLVLSRKLVSTLLIMTNLEGCLQRTTNLDQDRKRQLAGDIKFMTIFKRYTKQSLTETNIQCPPEKIATISKSYKENNCYLQSSFKQQKFNGGGIKMGPSVLHQKGASVTPNGHGMQSFAVTKNVPYNGYKTNKL